MKDVARGRNYVSEQFDAAIRRAWHGPRCRGVLDLITPTIRKGVLKMKRLKLAPIALCLGALFFSISGPARASGGTGGGGSTCDTTPVLPTTSPAPDIFMRESFGMSQAYRPTGGKGCNKPVFASSPLSGFWMEYPGSKNEVWLAAPESGRTWRFCAQSADPFELPSPLQSVTATGDLMNGCVISDWRDPSLPFDQAPTALIPLVRTAGAFQVSIDGWPAPIAGTYVAIGLTDSTLTINNLETSAGVWLLLKEVTLDNTLTAYELRLNGMTGPLLASGQFISQTFNQMAVRYDPATGMAGASLNGMELGSYPAGLSGTPKFVGFEGVGILDNFVVRALP
jgi:hypothetical protein